MTVREVFTVAEHGSAPPPPTEPDHTSTRSAQTSTNATALPTESHAASTGAAAETSFDEWVAARGPALLRFAHLVTGNLSDAQDAVQDVLISVYPKWSRIQATGTQEAYVRRAIANRHVSVWRAFRRREFPAAQMDTLDEKRSTTSHRGAGDPALTFADADLAWALCAQLPRTQRAAVVLRFYEDQSFAQIASALGCTESTARSHVRRALAALRARLEEGAPDE